MLYKEAICICVAIAATMYYVGEETKLKFTIGFQCSYAVSGQQLYNLINSTIPKGIGRTTKYKLV